MLKGLKKSKPKEQDCELAKQKVPLKESQLKKQAVLEEEEEGIPKISSRKIVEWEQRKQVECQRCYKLFLEGEAQLLEQALRNLMRYQIAEQPVQVKPKSKFEQIFDMADQKEGKQEPLKNELKKRNRPIMASNRLSQYCILCPDNEELELLSASNYVYLALPKHKTFKGYFHLILAPVDHEQTHIGLNQDTLTQIKNYQKCLLQAFDKIGLQVVFFEQFFKSNSHIYIECLPIPHARAQDLPFFFKQALEDVEGNWSTHKSIIKIEKEKGGLQKQIPKQIKYFYIDFSNGYGYAHVIENEKFWKKEWCYEILATALGLESHTVKSSEQFNEQQKAVKRENFSKIWRNYDWTQLI